MADLAALTAQALAQIGASDGLAALEELRVHWLGRKGVLTEQLKGLGKLKAAERPAAGARINAAKDQVQASIDARRGVLEQAAIARELDQAAIDVTLPGRGETTGGVHPITRVRLRIEALFRHAGYEIAEGP